MMDRIGLYCDIDGTVTKEPTKIDEGYFLTAAVMQAFRTLHEKKVPVYLLTGQSPTNIERLIQNTIRACNVTKWKIPIIADTGATIRSVNGKYSTFLRPTNDEEALLSAIEREATTMLKPTDIHTVERKSSSTLAIRWRQAPEKEALIHTLIANAGATSSAILSCVKSTKHQAYFVSATSINKGRALTRLARDNPIIYCGNSIYEGGNDVSAFEHTNRGGGLTVHVNTGERPGVVKTVQRDIILPSEGDCIALIYQISQMETITLSEIKQRFQGG
jgi:HAD superfamily hydrolase (TIGR01484 family)